MIFIIMIKCVKPMCLIQIPFKHLKCRSHYSSLNEGNKRLGGLEYYFYFNVALASTLSMTNLVS